MIALSVADCTVTKGQHRKVVAPMGLFPQKSPRSAASLEPAGAGTAIDVNRRSHQLRIVSEMAIFCQQSIGSCFFPDIGVLGVGFRAPHLSAIPFTLVHELGSLPPERQFPYSMLVRHLMPSSAPAANVAFVAEAISGLQRLQREMARLSQGDENYESKKRALQTAIQELRKMISAKA
jgi:hypothetical protein